MFWLLSSLLHLKFSLFLVNPLATPWGDIILKHYALEAGYILVSCFLIYLIWLILIAQKTPKAQLSNLFSRQAFSLIYIWIIWLVVIIFINLYLLATPIENIHFVQYALIAVLILKAFPHSRIDVVIFWTTLAGIIDEFMQYLWITAHYSMYLDFNDFLLNLMGAIAGVLFFISLNGASLNTMNSRSLLINKHYYPEVILSILIVLCVILFYYLGYIQLTAPHLIAEGGIEIVNQKSRLFIERAPDTLGHWEKAFNGGKYYILAAQEGIIVLLLTAIIFYKLIANYLFSSSLMARSAANQPFSHS